MTSLQNTKELPKDKKKLKYLAKDIDRYISKEGAQAKKCPREDAN
jgi:hypothetical protein